MTVLFGNGVQYFCRTVSLLEQINGIKEVVKLKMVIIMQLEAKKIYWSIEEKSFVMDCFG